MPELPEVEILVRGLRPDLEGRRIISFNSYWPPQLNNVDPQSMEARMKGQRVNRLWRRAKWIVVDLDHDFLLIHLKMTGRLYVAGRPFSAGGDRWVRAEFGLDDRRVLYFSDLRKFGRVWLVADLAPVFDALGPEPLDEAFTPNLFQDRLEGRAGVIKPLLMNQGLIAGVGNIYADEALWQAKIDPRRKANTLEKTEVIALHTAIRQVLQEGIDHEGASINWYRKADGTTGEYQERFMAYDREGEPCLRCGTPIVKIKLAQRGTHYCPRCQH
jgi:formamidopyrimidine-DNA glycosylase